MAVARVQPTVELSFTLNSVIAQEALHSGDEHLRVRGLGHELTAVPAGALNRAVPTMQHERDVEFFEALAQLRTVTVGKPMVQHRSGQTAALHQEKGLAKRRTADNARACGLEGPHDLRAISGSSSTMRIERPVNPGLMANPSSTKDREVSAQQMWGWCLVAVAHRSAVNDGRDGSSGEGCARGSENKRQAYVRVPA